MRNLGTIVLGACLALMACQVLAAPPSAAVSWSAPTANTDGSAIPAGALTYNLYQGLTGAEVKVQSALTAAATTVTAGLTAGTSQCFTVTAVEAGVESAPSAETCALIPKPVPGVPTQITVVIH